MEEPSLSQVGRHERKRDTRNKVLERAWSINVCSVCWAIRWRNWRNPFRQRGFWRNPQKRLAGLRLPQVLRRCLMLLSLLQSNLKDLAGLLTRRS